MPSFVAPDDQEGFTAVLVSKQDLCQSLAGLSAPGCFDTLTEAESYARAAAQTYNGTCLHALVTGCDVTSLINQYGNPGQIWNFSDATGNLTGAARLDDIGTDLAGCNSAEFARGEPRPACETERTTPICPSATTDP